MQMSTRLLNSILHYTHKHTHILYSHILYSLLHMWVRCSSLQCSAAFNNYICQLDAIGYQKLKFTGIPMVEFTIVLSNDEEVLTSTVPP